MLCNLVLLAQFVIFANCYYIEVIESDVVATLPDSPHWDAESGSLYYCDLMNQTNSLYRYDMHSGRTYAATIEKETGDLMYPGYILPIAERKDKFLVGLYHDQKVVKWDGKSKSAKSLCTQFVTDPELRANRVHDTHADPYGNVYVGVSRIPTTLLETCKPSNLPNGHVYKSTNGGPGVAILSNISNPNAMLWNLDKNKVYLIDSCKHKIRAYNWDPKTTELSDETVVFDLRKHYNLKDDELLPQQMDGATIDTEGNIYVAIIGSYHVFKINPETSEVLVKYKFPSPQIQAVTFGGPNLDILFVLSTKFTAHPEKLTKDCGKMYMIKDVGARGYDGRKLSKSFASCAPEHNFFSKVKNIFD